MPSTRVADTPVVMSALIRSSSHKIGTTVFTLVDPVQAGRSHRSPRLPAVAERLSAVFIRRNLMANVRLRGYDQQQAAGTLRRH